SGFDVMYGSGKMKLSDTLFSYDNMTDKLSNINSIYKIQYLQIPITLKMRTNEINYFRYYMRVGGSLGLRIGTKYTEEISAQDNSFIFRTYDNEKANNRISLFRATFDIGAGIEYSLGGTTALLGEIYFNNGLTNSLKEYKNIKYKSILNYLMFKIGILF
ncbi:MAG: outer membrane beta-barrel protein, partial [Bacteroidales bacterium]